MKRVAITGASGLVGSRIIELLHEEITCIPLSQPAFDITNQQGVEMALSAIDYDLLLHLAAYTDVDGAETNRIDAHSVNVEGTKNIFSITQKQKKPLIYISTDFVFDGKNPLYSELSKPNPISVYGETKFEAEQIVANSAMVVRISYPYRQRYPEKKDFVRKILDMLSQEKPIQMVSDSVITPTFIDDIAYGLLHLIHNYTVDTFHLVGTGSISPYEASKQIAVSFGLNPSLIQPVTFDSFFKGRAQRPQFSQLTSEKNNFYTMRTFKQGLELISTELQLSAT